MSKEPRANGRERRKLWLSLGIVVVLALGSLAATLAADWSPRLGLDLAGGVSVVYQPEHKISASEMNTEISILTNRVNAFGVSGAQVQQQGNNIAVTMPGIKNAQTVLARIGQTAQLYIRPVWCFAPPAEAKAKIPFPRGVTEAELSQVCPAKYQVNATNQGNVNPQPALVQVLSTTDDLQGEAVLLPGTQADGLRYALGPVPVANGVPLTGTIISSATAQIDNTGAWVVSCSLTSAGGAAWDTIAAQYFHQPVAIELDGVVESAPVILPGQSTFTSFNGTLQISGSFTQAEAQSLATVLTYGSLPVKLIPLQSQTVSPSLGHSSLIAGLGAGLAGLAVVMLYVIVYYRRLGLVIVTGLALTAALLWAIISALGHTSLAPSFTLAGVTGLIVSIGITVDSYIVYFERLKDETRSGRSVRTSVDRGFKSAWRTVLAADLVSLLAAVVLYELALGDVRGFAFFLGLSTILDIFVTYFFTRPVVYLMGRSERATGGRFGVARGLAVEGGDLR